MEEINNPSTFGKAFFIAFRGNLLYKRIDTRLFEFKRNNADEPWQLGEVVDQNCTADVMAIGRHLHWRDGGSNVFWRGQVEYGKLRGIHPMSKSSKATAIAAFERFIFWRDEAGKLNRGCDCLTEPAKDGMLKPIHTYEEDWPYNLLAADGDHVFGANRNKQEIDLFLVLDQSLQKVKTISIEYNDLIDISASEGTLALLTRTGPVHLLTY